MQIFQKVSLHTWNLCEFGAIQTSQHIYLKGMHCIFWQFSHDPQKKVPAKKITAKIFLEKNILHCRRTLTLTACDFLKIAKFYSQQEKHLSHKCFVPHSVHFIRFFINIIIIWDHIQMPNIFHDKTVYNK